VEDTGWLYVFSLADGALRGTIKLPFSIYEVHFDVRRSEFWGETWQDSPVVWSWRPGEPFRIEKIPASWIYKAFALRNGERVLAVTVSTAAIDEDVHRSRIALAMWDGHRLRFLGVAPPCDDERGKHYVVMGSLALHTGFVDPDNGRPITPDFRPFSEEGGFFVWRPSPDRWAMIESETLRILESGNDGRSWAARGALMDDVETTTLIALETDPYQKGAAYALLRVGEDDERRLQLWSARSEDSGWRSLWRGPAEASEEAEEPPGDLLFDENAVWIQRTWHSSTGERSIHLSGVPRSGAPRELTLELPAPEKRSDGVSPEKVHYRPTTTATSRSNTAPFQH
jgi:hypothetical protein